MAEDLEARLQSHSKAFEGLMSLIPAKYYYGEDNDDQWQRKKQTKEEKRAAKRAKLAPEAYKSALDVHKERELKRKRELEEESDGSNNGSPKEQPKEGLVESRKSLKKQKLDNDSKDESMKSNGAEPATVDESVVKKAKAEKRKEKRAQKLAKKARKLEKAEAKKLRKQKEAREPESDPSSVKDDKSMEAAREAEDDESDGDDEATSKQLDDHIEFKGAEELAAVPSESSRSPSPPLDTPTFSHSHGPSSASSTSSANPLSDPEIVDPSPNPSSPAKPTLSHLQIPAQSTTESQAIEEPAHKPKAAGESSDDVLNGDGNHVKPQIHDSVPYEKSPKLLPINQERLKERLAARIAALRAERKADGLDGKPARNRAELIEARRRKEEAKRAHKKELRNKAKEQDAEAEAARLRGGSGSPLWNSPGVFGPTKATKIENNFSFGRVTFDDGTQVDSSLGGFVDPKKKKGPQDPKTALEAAQNKKSRLSGLDEKKRTDIEEKDRWLNAKKRVQGERLRDDTSLLKKTLKRKQKGKDKSEKAWQERTDGVQKSIEARQAKRESNLAKRKDDKGAKKGVSKPSGPTKPKKRPGFEGSFKTGHSRVN